MTAPLETVACITLSFSSAGWLPATSWIKEIGERSKKLQFS